MAKKVLVTGSCGFIYSNFIIYALQNTDWDLVSVDKLTYAGSRLNISHNKDIQMKRHKFYLADVCDYHTIEKIFDIEKPDIVIHSAAESNVDRSIDSSHEFIKTNVIGTHSMLEAAKNVHTPELFVNSSTDEVFGQILEGSFDESSMLDPRNPYSASKASADLLGQSYYETHGLPVVTTRCCNVFGPRQDITKLVPKSIVNVLTGKKIPIYGKGNQVRQWIYTRDVYNAVKCIIEKGTAGEVYNISSDQERTNIEIIDMMCKELGVGKEVLEFVDDRKGHDFRYAVDASKLKALGWKSEYELEGAIAHTVNWYRANKWGWK